MSAPIVNDQLSFDQLSSLSTIERACSVLSLLGCIFIIITFSLSKAFHKPINRLVFYASFGNMMTNVGTLMAREYINFPNSVGCQFQAFLIQMFMPADAFWTLAMAVNVYLTFYYKFDAEKLRRMEIWYFLFCYGLPFIPALAYIFITNKDGKRVYGNANLWCWVSREWDIYRIATFYGPVWIVIFLTFFIYLRAGGEIFKKRKQLRDFSTSTHDPEPLTYNDPNSFKTTEVSVTSEVIDQSPNAIDLAPLGGRRGDGQVGSSAGHNPAYSITISSNKNARNSTHSEAVLPNTPTVQLPATAAREAKVKSNKRRANFEANNAAWSYTKCALLFFTAILVTWIPSSANRVYSVINIGENSVPLEYMSAFVLPLQGFWNALIYVVTSWKACKIFFQEIGHRESRHRDVMSAGAITDRRNTAFRMPNMRSNKDYESESMTELASRPSSNDIDEGKQPRR